MDGEDLRTDYWSRNLVPSRVRHVLMFAGLATLVLLLAVATAAADDSVGGRVGYEAGLYSWAMIPPVEDRFSECWIYGALSHDDQDRPCTDGGDTVSFALYQQILSSPIEWVRLYRGARDELGDLYGEFTEADTGWWVLDLSAPGADCSDWMGGGISAVIGTQDYPEGEVRGTFYPVDRDNPIEQGSWGTIKARYRAESPSN